MPRLHILRLHAGYRCRHAGVCCTEDWAIPVEAPVHQHLSQALERSTLRPGHVGVKYFESAEGLKDETLVVTGRVGHDCAFFEPSRGRLCSIHSQLGHSRLPSACQHFPRVVTIDPRGIFVSISHVCPTAGRLLVDPVDAPFDVVHDGAILTPGLEWAGLDAREGLPPQVSADVLWDWDALTVWERGVLETLAHSSAEGALSEMALAASSLERWRPREGQTLAVAATTAFDAARLESRPHHIDGAAVDALARQSAPHALAVHAVPTDRAEADRDLVAPVWDNLGPLVCRYLAARTVANAVMYHTARAAVLAAWVRAAYAVLRTECARHAARADRPLDTGLLVAAAADADRLLVHRIDAARLAVSLQTALPHGTSM